MTVRSIPGYFIAICAVFVAGCEPDLLNMANSWGSLSCCSLIVVIMDIIAIVEIIGSRRNTAEKLIWILFIVFAPFLGFFCYYIFANRS